MGTKAGKFGLVGTGLIGAGWAASVVSWFTGFPNIIRSAGVRIA